MDEVYALAVLSILCAVLARVFWRVLLDLLIILVVALAFAGLLAISTGIDSLLGR